MPIIALFIIFNLTSRCFFCIFAKTEVAANLVEFYLHELHVNALALLWKTLKLA